MASVGKVSQIPTNPRKTEQRHEFDVADLYRGPAGEVAPTSSLGFAANNTPIERIVTASVNCEPRAQSLLGLIGDTLRPREAAGVSAMKPTPATAPRRLICRLDCMSN